MKVRGTDGESSLYRISYRSLRSLSRRWRDRDFLPAPTK